jgi:hypothetical protein
LAADAETINGANGQTNWGAKTVVVRADMDDAAMVKTLIHDPLTAPTVLVLSTTWGAGLVPLGHSSGRR